MGELREQVAAEWLPWLLVLLGLVVAAALVEGLALQFICGRRYDWRASAASLADVLGRRLVDGLGVSLSAPLLAAAWQHRIATLSLDTAWQWLALFVGLEFFYYLYHHCAHRVRWFWATHAVHHSSNELTLASALRLGWTGKITGTAMFFAPLAWLGFAPAAVLGALALNLLYQFWLHATWIPKLGPFEWVLNTPSHHRAHHGANPRYLDCNFGGVLIVFDRLFGSFVEECDDDLPRYGLTEPLMSHNPLRIALGGWIELLRDLMGARSLPAALRVMLGPP